LIALESGVWLWDSNFNYKINMLDWRYVKCNFVFFAFQKLFSPIFYNKNSNFTFNLTSLSKITITRSPPKFPESKNQANKPADFELWFLLFAYFRPSLYHWLIRPIVPLWAGEHALRTKTGSYPEPKVACVNMWILNFPCFVFDYFKITVKIQKCSRVFQLLVKFYIFQPEITFSD
jgi:hypothetical protein